MTILIIEEYDIELLFHKSKSKIISRIFFQKSNNAKRFDIELGIVSFFEGFICISGFSFCLFNFRNGSNFISGLLKHTAIYI